MGFVVNNDGRLLYDKASPSDAAQAVFDRLPAVTFGFDHCTVKGAEAAYGNFQKYAGFLTSIFPHLGNTQSPWELTDCRSVDHVDSVQQAVNDLFILAQKTKATYVGWTNPTFEALAVLASKLRYSNKIKAPTLPITQDSATTIVVPPPDGCTNSSPPSSHPA